MNCKICGTLTQKDLTQQILQKYMVSYYSCPHCHFIQTEEPYWLSEAYQNVITELDIGLINRNLYLKEQIPTLIDALFPESKIMIDYGGGYGIFVRIMRDLGYNFYRQDIYCENLFAKHFDVKDITVGHFDVLTAFEVLEHLAQPMAELDKMLALSDNLIFTTVLAPDKPTMLKDWWYLSPLTGQHVSFYQLKTLQYIAQKLGKQVYSNGTNLHVFSNKVIAPKLVRKVFGTTKIDFFGRIKTLLSVKSTAINGKPTLLQADYAYIEKKLTNNS